MSAWRAAAAAALAVALGCTALNPRQPLPSPLEGEWAAARRDATRRFALYDGLVHRATAAATHLGLPEREARARRMAEWQGWTPEELAQRLAAEAAEAAAGEEFVLSFYSANMYDNDLDARRSVWRISLHVDGAQLRPASVTAIESDSTVRTLYPYVGTFDVVYRVRFPPAPGGAISGRPFVLQLASALGKIDLDYGVPVVNADVADQPAPGPIAP